jgi:hypothetical protein
VNLDFPDRDGEAWCGDTTSLVDRPLSGEAQCARTVPFLPADANATLLELTTAAKHKAPNLIDSTREPPFIPTAWSFRPERTHSDAQQASVLLCRTEHSAEYLRQLPA